MLQHKVKCDLWGVYRKQVSELKASDRSHKLHGYAHMICMFSACGHVLFHRVCALRLVRSNAQTLTLHRPTNSHRSAAALLPFSTITLLSVKISSRGSCVVSLCRVDILPNHPRISSSVSSKLALLIHARKNSQTTVRRSSPQWVQCAVLPTAAGPPGFECQLLLHTPTLRLQDPHPS